MNKKDFMKNLNEEIQGITLDKQIELLQKIQNVWLTDMINAKKKKQGTWVEPEKKDLYFYCPECGKYTLKTKCKTEFEREVRTVTTYRDAAYGDGDLEGDVEYLVKYIICPKCGRKHEERKHRVRTICEWVAKLGRVSGRIK